MRTLVLEMENWLPWILHVVTMDILDISPLGYLIIILFEFLLNNDTMKISTKLYNVLCPHQYVIH